jgi:hypothetical protein
VITADQGREAVDMAAERARASRAGTVVRLERWTLVGMALGVALMLQPWWPGGMRAGFFVTLGSTLAQIVLGHMAGRER